MSLSTNASAKNQVVQEEFPKVRKFMFDRSFEEDDMRLKKSSAERSSNDPQIKKTKNEEIFTKEQLEKTKREAYEKGIIDGRKQAEDNLIHQHNELLSKIEKHLSVAMDRSSQQWQKILIHTRELAVAIVRKMLPLYFENYGAQEIESIISRALTEMAHEPRIVIRIGESRFEEISEKINAIVEKAAFSGKVAVLCEASLGPVDCRVEWADGGFERDSNALWTEIEKIVRQEFVSKNGLILQTEKENSAQQVDSAIEKESEIGG